MRFWLIAQSGRLSVAGATLRVMDTFGPPASAYPEALLTDSGQAALRDEALGHLAMLPFSPGAPISRTLWLMFLCPQGIRTRAVMPVDDTLELPDPDNIAGLCDIVALCMEHAMPGERALVALHRPGTAGISDADEYIFRVMSEAATSRNTAAWAFYVTGPDGVQELSGSRP
jgi:hypothetical protein